MKGIPEIEFKSATDDIIGFEIIRLEKIKSNREQYRDDPEAPHQPNFYILTFYTHGKSTHLVDFKSYPVQKNSLAYISKNQINAFSFNDEIKGYCILFSQTFFERCFRNMDKTVTFRLFAPQIFEPILQVSHSSDLESYIELLYKEFYHEDSNTKAVIVESLFTIILAKAEELRKTEVLSNVNSSKSMMLSKFLNLIDKHHPESRNAEFYADKLAITYKHLNSICKELLKKTAKGVIDDYIILLAKRKLIDPGVRTSSLSYSMGFDDATNFIKYFKARTGLTPNQFKKALKKR